MFSVVRKIRVTKNTKKSVNVYCTVNQYTPEPNVVQSKVPRIKIPDILLEECLWNGLDKWHDKIALVSAETGRSYRYSDIYKKSRTLSNFLHRIHNLKQHDTLAIILPNVPEYPIIMLGVIQAGFKVTTINPIFTADEIAKQLLNSETKVIFTLTELWPKIKQASNFLKYDVPILVVEQQQNESVPSGAIKFNEISEGGHQLSFNISRNSDDTIIIPYSSGTTGIPKGVELTNKTIVSNLYQMATPKFRFFDDAEGSHQEILPTVLPMFHIYGMVMGTLHTLSSGCKLITVSKFGSQIFTKILKQCQPSFAYLVPPIVLLLLNNPQIQPKDITQMRTIVCGAAPLGGADVERLHQKAEGKVNFLQGYGLTEASPLTHVQSNSFPNGNKLGGSGFALPNTECKIVAPDDDTLTGLGPNESGELLIRGPQIMKGYYKNEEASQSVLMSNGWLRTGDISHYDQDAHFCITDRLKELIKVKGFQVAPAELEELLRDHPDVEDAAVVGVTHPSHGEAPKAFVVPRANCRVDASKIQDYIKNKVADYKRLEGGVAIVKSIPKTASGKILRRQLREM